MYAWKAGARMKVSAEVAGNVCAKLEQEGGLTAKRLVDVSRPEEAPLHGEFEWDDSAAAEKYRETQARDIMGHLIIVSEDKPAEPIRAYFNISEGDPKYYSASVVVSEADKYEQLKQRVIRELVAIQKRYAMVKGLNALDAVIEKIKEAS